MSAVWEPKAPADTVDRRWAVPLCDGISAVSAVGAGITVTDTDYTAAEAVLTLSGGVSGVGASVVVTVTTNDGLSLSETFLIAIRAEAPAFTYTAQDVCAFALRKIAGLGEDASAEQLADAMERLNDVLAQWRIAGLDVGFSRPLVSTDPIVIPDEFIAALKFTLRAHLHDFYGVPLSPLELQQADTAQRLVLNRLVKLGDLQMNRTLRLREDPVFR